jgi:hypothetical protein
MPFVIAALAAVGLFAATRRTNVPTGIPPSSPKPGDTWSYVDASGQPVTATWNGTAWTRGLYC